jgi:hypothetical protein
VIDCAHHGASAMPALPSPPSCAGTLAEYLPPGLPVRLGFMAKRKPGRPPNAPVPDPVTAEAFLISMEHLLPELPGWLKQVKDPRKRLHVCTYSMDEILMLCLVMLCCQRGSRRQLDRDRTREQFLLNFRMLLGDDEAAVTCADNMNRVLTMVAPGELEKLAVRCTKALNRRKVLRKFKYDGMLVIAVDGTQMLSFSSRHCEHCLTRTLSNGTTEYYHYVLAAKVVTPIGLVLPVAFEFVENPAGKFDKQDCETKAFRRLALRMNRLLKGFQVLLVGDGLYANEPVMEICERYGWSYMATLTDDHLPTLQEQVARAKQDRAVIDGSGRPRLKATRGQTEEYDPETKLTRIVRWITPLRYHGRIVHWIEMQESGTNGDGYHNVWITDIKPNRHNAMALAKAGRMRWKIENEGINTQKTGGYEMEHGYGVKGNAWKNYYLLLQIAQLLNDLYRLGDLPAKLTEDVRSTFAALYGSVRNFAGRLMESLRNDVIRRDSGPDPGTIQIRFPDPPPALLLT